MKVLAAITICLVLSAGAQANFFDDLKTSFSQIGDQFSQTFKGVLDTGKQVGTQLITQLGQTGTALASQALSTLAQNLLSSVATSTGQTAPVAPATGNKRDLSNVLSTLGQSSHQLQQVLGGKFTNLENLFHAGVNKLNEISQNVLHQPLQTTLSQVDNAVASHNLLTDTAMKDIVHTIEQHAGSFIQKFSGNKRGVSDTISQLGSSIASFFQPHINTLKSIFSGLGEAVKQTASQLSTSVGQSVSQLGTQLHGHVDTLKQSGNAIVQHGQNALSALKSAVSDILQQTLTNIQPHVQNIIDTGKNAASVATNTLAQGLANGLSKGAPITTDNEGH